MPSIIDGLFAARSGIQSHGTAISVLADNIANQNTTGFKASRADFSDLLAGTLGGSSTVQLGSGSTISGVTPILSQGTFEFTGRGLDMGIDGNGFFAVEDNASGQRYYTRAGNMKIDTDGYLLDQNGYRVMGYSANGAGGLGNLNVNERTQETVSTQEASISGNLNAAAEVFDPTATVPTTGDTWQEFSEGAQFSTFVDVYDSLGASHTVTIFFFHTAAAHDWVAKAVVDAGELTGAGLPAAGNPVELGLVNLDFDNTGARDPLPTGPDVTIAPAWSNGAAASSIKLSLHPFTQFSSNSTISSISQDGTGSGSVVGFTVQEDGTLFAQLDNGQTASIGKIALATFANAEGLRRVGNSLFAETANSGEPVIGTPNTGTFGALTAGALELSTADIAADFIKLISLQRGFQGSSRIITNINDLLKEIVNLA